MPFTPLHFGPALAVREVVGHKRFGIVAFALTQILFDIEPGVRMLLDLDGTLHQTTHNPAFGVVYALMASACLWKWEKWSAVVGAVFGSVTHLWLDALYHSDVASAMKNWGNPASARDAGIDPEVICYLGFLLWIVFATGRWIIRTRSTRAARKLPDLIR